MPPQPITNNITLATLTEKKLAHENTDNRTGAKQNQKEKEREEEEEEEEEEEKKSIHGSTTRCRSRRGSA